MLSGQRPLHAATDSVLDALLTGEQPSRRLQAVQVGGRIAVQVGGRRCGPPEAVKGGEATVQCLLGRNRQPTFLPRFWGEMAGEEAQEAEPVPPGKANGCINREASPGREKRTQSDSSSELPSHAAKRVRFNDACTTHEIPASIGSGDQEVDGPSAQRDREGGGSPTCDRDEEGDEAQDDSETRMFGREAVDRIRRQRRQKATLGHLGKFEPEDTDVDVINSKAAAQAAQEADPVEQIGDSGVPMEPFNMRREMEEGSFDDDGNYVWKKGKSDHVTDGWLDAVDAGDPFANFKTEEGRLRAAAQPADRQEDQKTDIASTMRKLCSILRNMETPAAALRRLKQTTEDHVTPLTSAAQDRHKKVLEDALREEALGGPSASSVSGSQLSSESADAEVVERDEEDAASSSFSESTRPSGSTLSAAEEGASKFTGQDSSLSKSTFSSGEVRSRSRGPRGRFKMTKQAVEDFERITELCDRLIAEGCNVYFMSRPSILEAAAEKEGDDTQDTEQLSADKTSETHTSTLWQFRWVNNPVDGEEHGPYDSATMQAWVDQGFISDRTPVEVRQVSEANDPLDGLWRSWLEVNFCELTECGADEADEWVEAHESGEKGGAPLEGDADADNHESPDDVDHGL